MRPFKSSKRFFLGSRISDCAYNISTTSAPFASITVGETAGSNAVLEIEQDVTLTVSGNFTGTNSGNIYLGGGATLSVGGTLGLYDSAKITVRSKNNSAMVTGSWQGAGGTITAVTAIVSTSASISADKEGYQAINSSAGLGVGGTGAEINGGGGLRGDGGATGRVGNVTF